MIHVGVILEKIVPVRTEVFFFSSYDERDNIPCGVYKETVSIYIVSLMHHTTPASLLNFNTVFNFATLLQMILFSLSQ